MPVRIGVIADDLTGAADIAGFLVSAGLRTAQFNGPAGAKSIPSGLQAEAVVIGLKTRSAPPEEAVAESLDALRVLRSLGAGQIIFKYCSTFDSTPKGNIGPVTDALLDALDEDFTVVAPSLPVNGRTVHQGNLFVHGVPLAESGMKNHPVTPMTDSNVVRLMDRQSRGRAQSVPVSVLEGGVDSVRRALGEARAAGYRYAVLDTLTEAHLETIGRAVADLALVTGGSGIGFGLGLAHSGQGSDPAKVQWKPLTTRTVVLSGSASEMTNQQVAAYRKVAPAYRLDVGRILNEPDPYRHELVEAVLNAEASGPAPMVYATDDAAGVLRLQDRYGAATVSRAIEEFFGALAVDLRQRGVGRFVVAGGETSGAVTLALQIQGFEIGPLITPGVPWMRSLTDEIELALKSGNFGGPDFFRDAQETAQR